MRRTVTLGFVKRSSDASSTAAMRVFSRRSTRTALALAAGRGGIYFLVFSDVLLRHFVPPHPWKAGLAYFATLGLVVLVESLWIRTSARENRARDVALGAVVVISAFALAFGAATVGLFGPN